MEECKEDHEFLALKGQEKDDSREQKWRFYEYFHISMFEKLAGIELCNQANTKLKFRNELDTTESVLTQSLINFK
jgi:hypothetical protein